MLNKIIGVLIGENTTTKVEFISTERISNGLYVCMEYNNQTVLGMVSEVYVGNKNLDDELKLPDEIEEIKNYIGNDEEYTRGTINILGDIKSLNKPRIPAPSNTKVRKATPQELKSIFNNKKGLSIGHILTEPDVEVKLDLNQLIGKHLAILSMTGAGKSNTTAILIDELLKQHGCIVLFDMHDEYGNIEFENGEINKITPKINPFDLRKSEFMKLSGISSEATTQTRKVSEALDQVLAERNKELNNISNDYPNVLHNEEGQKHIKEYIIKKYKIEYIDHVQTALKHAYDTESNNRTKDSIQTAMEKIKYNLGIEFKTILDEDADIPLIDQIKPNKVNIINLMEIPETHGKIITEIILRDILRGRKNYKTNNTYNNTIDYPIFCIIEEAHILASKKDENTGVKYQIGKIAREGRKFGVGLGLISQRPKTLDPEILSQINNWILLRIVEPSDQRYIQECNDSMSNDLIKELPSLGTGEALIIGPSTKLPTICKIKQSKNKKFGENLNIQGEWNEYYYKHIKNS